MFELAALVSPLANEKPTSFSWSWSLRTGLPLVEHSKIQLLSMLSLSALVVPLVASTKSLDASPDFSVNKMP